MTWVCKKNKRVSCKTVKNAKFKVKMRINGYIKDGEAYLVKYHEVIESKVAFALKAFGQSHFRQIVYSYPTLSLNVSLLAPCCVCALLTYCSFVILRYFQIITYRKPFFVEICKNNIK